MKKNQYLILLVIASSAIFVGYSNCSRVQISELPMDLKSSSELAESAPEQNHVAALGNQSAVLPSNFPAPEIAKENHEPDFYIPSPEEQEQVKHILPPSQTTDSPVPVTELIDKPELFEVYKCPNTDDKVMICHFPQGANFPNTQCVGRSAVSSHFGHLRVSVQPDGSQKSEADYLGPCRGS